MQSQSFHSSGGDMMDKISKSKIYQLVRRAMEKTKGRSPRCAQVGRVGGRYCNFRWGRNTAQLWVKRSTRSSAASNPFHDFYSLSLHFLLYKMEMIITTLQGSRKSKND